MRVCALWKVFEQTGQKGISWRSSLDNSYLDEHHRFQSGMRTVADRETFDSHMDTSNLHGNKVGKQRENHQTLGRTTRHLRQSPEGTAIGLFVKHAGTNPPKYSKPG